MRKPVKNVKHSKGDPNWITPGEGQPIDYVGRSRRALGGVIDLDPYSSDIANTIVKANRYFTEKDDGHAQPWDSDAILVNPPGLQVANAWVKLRKEVSEGRARKVIWIGFSVEQLNLLADPHGEWDGDENEWRPWNEDYRLSRGYYHPLDFSVLIVRKRIDFLKEETLKKGGRPSHGNYIVGIGMPHSQFSEAFHDLGYIHKGPLSQE